MALSKTIDDREYKKFTENSNGKTTVRVISTLPSGDDKPTEAFIYDVVSVTNTATPLRVGGTNQTNRKTIVVQPKGSTIYIGYDNTVTAGNNGTGEKITNGSTVEIDVDENTTIYAIRSGGGSVNVHVTEKALV